jgi:hypothetical protein
MNNLDRRIKRLEEQQGACNHRSPLILTQEQVERKKKELDECPNCEKHGRPRLLIIDFFDPNVD